ncbi:efflux RND transporter permease subunit, partial [Endozoicomonas sp.]|uniref:efflux RND transporter permease subunit n=1 Tax=Endozoicomonas sp. TaxID=1892382 RepID=UPI00383BE806
MGTEAVDTKRGALAWMARDRVTPNLLMLFLILGGLFTSWQIKKEVMPPFEADIVDVKVSYSGSTPEEIDLGIILPVENAIQGIDGVYQINSTASSGSARVRVELLDGADPQQVLNDIDQEVSRLTTLPAEAEKPTVTLASHRRNVMELMFYGEVDDTVLRTLVENSRDRLLLDPGLTQIELKNAPDHEVQVQANPDQLRRYGLTINDVAGKISNQALDQSSGQIESSGGDISVRVQERRDQVNEFQNIPVKSLPGGATLLLRDVAEVKRAFEDSPRESRYNGQPALAITIYRIGDQTPLGVSDAVRAILPEIEASLPPGVSMEITEDDSDVYRDRMDLLLKNAFIGLLLVLVLLSLFLEYRLAFWVTMGIPTSFLGAMILLPGLGVSINMISMFSFIIALGIVVDDAIIAGENIYHRRQQGMGVMEAAIQGAKDVAVPLTFSILTNMIAFLPILALPGVLGKMQQATPLVVISVFAISWIEALFILPAHLGQMKEKSESGFGRFMHSVQKGVDQRLKRFISGIYHPALETILNHRYITLSVAVAILVTAMAWQASGRLGFVMFPRVDADSVKVTAKLPYGSPEASLQNVLQILEQGGLKVVAENGGEALVSGYESRFGGDEVSVTLYLTAPDVRPLSTEAVTNLWREANGTIYGLETITYNRTGHGPGGGAALTIELGHSDTGTLQVASDYLMGQLGFYG